MRGPYQVTVYFENDFTDRAYSAYGEFQREFYRLDEKSKQFRITEVLIEDFPYNIHVNRATIKVTFQAPLDYITRIGQLAGAISKRY